MSIAGNSEPHPVELEELLGTLAGEGRKDSSGGFSVDLVHAVSKLNLYRSSDPGNYLKHLHGAAVALGARNFSIKTGSTWEVSFDGRSLSFEELTQIMPSLVAPQAGLGNFALRELGLALNNLRATANLRLQLDTAHGSLELHPRYLQVTPRKQITAGCRLQVKAGDALSSVMMLGKPVLPPEHFDLVQPHLRLSPLAMTINGRARHSVEDWGRCRGVLAVQGQSRLPEIAVNAARRQEVRHPGNFSMLLALFPDSGSGQLDVVHVGQLFVHELPPDFVPARALIIGDTFRRDLTGTRLVEDAEYRSLLDCLGEQLQQLATANLDVENVREKLEALAVQGWAEQLRPPPTLDRIPCVRLRAGRSLSLREIESDYRERGRLELDGALVPRPVRVSLGSLLTWLQDSHPDGPLFFLESRLLASFVAHRVADPLSALHQYVRGTGASELAISDDGYTWGLGWDAGGLTQEQMRELLPLVESEEPSPLRDLARILAALHCDFEQCALSGPAGTLLVTRWDVQFVSERTETNMRLSFPAGRKGDWATRFSAYGDLRYRLNGQPLGQDGLDWGECLATLHLRGQRPLPKITVQAAYRFQADSDGDTSVLVALYAGQQAYQWTLLSDGQAYPHSAADLPFQAAILVRRDGLATVFDLAGPRLNDRRALSEATDLARDLLWELVERCLEFPDAQQRIEDDVCHLLLAGHPGRHGKLACLQTGGPRLVSYEEIYQEFVDRGFVVYDPERTSPWVTEVLKKGNALCQSPLFAPPALPCLFACPMRKGHWLYLGEGAPGGVFHARLPVATSLVLPEGLQIHLAVPPGGFALHPQDLKNLAQAVIWQPQRVRQRGEDPPHAPPLTRGPIHVRCLRLALWLAHEADPPYPHVLTHTFVPLYPVGAMSLARVLENDEPLCFIQVGSEERLAGRSHQPALWLTALEAEAIRPHRPLLELDLDFL